MGLCKMNMKGDNMNLDELKEIALKAIKANPGSTRMEWFKRTFPDPQDQDTMWHTFKFRIAMIHVLSGRVRAKDDGDIVRFFHSSHQPFNK